MNGLFEIGARDARSTYERDRTQPLTIDLIDDTAGFASLEQDWNELLAASDVDNLFLTWEWMFTWWKHLAADCTLHVLAVRRGSMLIAIAPFALRRASLWSLPPVAALQFLGSGVVGSDYLDLIVRRGHSEEVIELLRERLSASGRALSLMRMRPNGPAASLVAQLSNSGFRVWCGADEVCPYASLRGQSFDSYLAGLGSEHRYAFRRKLNRIERRFQAKFELVADEAERAPALDSLFALHATRWQTRGESGAIATQALRDFHHEFTRVALAAGWLRLWSLKLNGSPAAALYGFLYRRRFYFYQSGFDPAFARESVGLVLLGTAVRGAIADGADELDLLHGTERYKAHWARTSRELVRRELYAPGTRGWLESEATALTRDARRVARFALETARRALHKPVLVEHA